MSEPTPEEQKVINFMEAEYRNWFNFFNGFENIIYKIVKDETLTDDDHLYWMVFATFLDSFISNIPSTETKQEKVDMLISVLEEIRNKPADITKIISAHNVPELLTVN